MGKKKKIIFPRVQMPKDSHAKLLKYAQSKGIPMSEIIADFIDKGVEHDIFDGDWGEKLKLYEEKVNAYANLDKSCVALAFGMDLVDKKEKKVWRCIWFREDGPPIIRKLGNTESLMAAACLACDKTAEIVTGFRERDERIAELEKGLKAKSSERFRIPKCNSGAVLNHDREDRMIFTNCPKNRSGPVSIKNYCRVLKNGLPCFMFAEITVGVGLKE